MNKFGFCLAGALVLASSASAQTPFSADSSSSQPDYPAATGSVIGSENNTGGDVNVIIPRGPTGADTFQSNSAAAGNANQPERAVPQGSGGGGNGAGGN